MIRSNLELPRVAANYLDSHPTDGPSTPPAEDTSDNV